MSSACRKIVPSLAVLAMVGCAAHADVPTRRVLRVCADPNNLPFSNDRREGFENKIAQLVADEMHADVEYTWWAQRRGFFRNTLKACKCDVVMGVPASFEMATTTEPYYRSTYVFVSRKDKDLHIHSFDDPQLKRLRVGVHLIGDDGYNTPPAHALSRRGIITNVKGYSIYGDYSQPNPPEKIIEAVEKGDIDVAIVWGPFAGYGASQANTDLTITPVDVEVEQPFLPFAYDIAMGVRRGDDTLLAELDAIIKKRKGSIDSILSNYAVPRKQPTVTLTAAH